MDLHHGVSRRLARRSRISPATASLTNAALQSEVTRRNVNVASLRAEEIHHIRRVRGVTLIPWNEERVRSAGASAFDHPLTLRDEILEERLSMIRDVL